MTFRLTTLLLITTFILSSCEKTVPDLVEQPSVMDYKLMTPAYYRDADDGGSIQIRFYESQRIYDLARSADNFETLKKLVDDGITAKKPVRVFTGTDLHEYVALVSIDAASSVEIARHKSDMMPAPETFETKKQLPNMAALNDVFAYCAAQGCATGTATIDYCIPFQYAVDGCYARAHKMRQIMFEEYMLSCEKVFSYEGNHGSLAVDVGDCCVLWWYHVAPLVTVKLAGGGTAKYVIDPSMFAMPFSIATWTAAQETASCPGASDFGYYEITPGIIYTPGGGTDNSLSSTNSTLQFYADLVSCD